VGTYRRPGWTPLRVQADGERITATVEGAPLLDAEGTAGAGRLMMRHPGCRQEMPDGLVPVVGGGAVVALDGALGRFDRSS
jgi:hypothetical protein